MAKTIISEGKTTNEAIEKGLKELNVNKNMVNIKILENEEKRSFFSILAPRVVKVELTLKENEEKESNSERIKENKPKKEIHLSEEEQEKAVANVKKLLEELKEELPENTEYKIIPNENVINVEITSEHLGYLIGYRG